MKMATMKIGSITQSYADATFSFPNNPKSVDVPFVRNDTETIIPYGKFHIFFGNGGIVTRNLVFTGEMHGSSRLANLNLLMTQIGDNDIKRFWISGTRFYDVRGMSLKHTYQGGRANFIDYVLSMSSVLPYANGTARQYSVTISNASETALNDATGSSTGSFDNSGNAPAFIKWTIENTTGSAITKIELGDASTQTASPNIIEWSGSLTSGNTLVIDVIRYVPQTGRGGAKVSEFFYAYALGDTTFTKVGTITNGVGPYGPWVNASASDQACSVTLTGNDAAAVVTADWFDAYYVG